ncbi:ABC transporter permease [Neolewinella antarctica]|uniref:ABC transport system permease protein n=1 Tax=Neolewinella antarctica TaxID=442734 RepID=A0ABX0X9Y9_9BACT|nr:FtsX-like permease family protein [Neolewinella antarctica]NJC26064.1 putative ABC transport system permease protein [Neolewinella antarctica]
MITHLVRLMWNKRRANALILLEILLAFLVLFGVYAFGFYNLDRFSSPLGFSYENSVGLRLNLPEDMDSASTVSMQKRIRDEILLVSGVEQATFIGSINPFSGNMYFNGNDDNGYELRTQGFFADEHFAETMNLELREGRWFDETDVTSKYIPVLVNGALMDEFYPAANSLVDSILIIEGEKKIIGVVENFKYRSNFSENAPLTFFPTRSRDVTKYPFQMMIIRASSGRTAAIEEPIYNLVRDITKNTDVVIWNMADDRIKANKPVVVPLVVLTLISTFLLINIALGLFGVLFTQINRRRAEIGLRKAMGATPAQITTQFVLEVLLVATAALLLGVFFAVQVPILELTSIPAKFFYFGIVAAIITILLIVFLCASIPSRQAAGLQPADVLHED